MNIFYLSRDPVVCAQEHCDKHILKMIVEYGQLLSTTYRWIEGTPYLTISKANRKITRYLLEEPLESTLYKATHMNHPCACWVRDSLAHYNWLLNLLKECCFEYTHRYQKHHKTEELIHYLQTFPKGLIDKGYKDPPPVMPQEYISQKGVIESYRNYYKKGKSDFMTWKSPRSAPEWFRE